MPGCDLCVHEHLPTRMRILGCFLSSSSKNSSAYPQHAHTHTPSICPQASWIHTPNSFWPSQSLLLLLLWYLLRLSDNSLGTAPCPPCPSDNLICLPSTQGSRIQDHHAPSPALVTGAQASTSVQKSWAHLIVPCSAAARAQCCQTLRHFRGSLKSWFVWENSQF